MKSPRNWALQHVDMQVVLIMYSVEMKSPRNWALQQQDFHRIVYIYQL